MLRQLEIDYAGNIAGGESRMVRSLCYDMGHVFDDEEELADCIADMRAIGEGSVTEYAFVKWWYKNATNIVLPLSYSAEVLDAIRHFKYFDESSCGALTTAQLLLLCQDLNWPNVEAWRVARVLGDEQGVVSLRAFLLLYHDEQLVQELLRVYDVDQNGKLSRGELTALCAEWQGVNEQAAALLMRQYDTDSDAELDKVELLNMIRTGREAASAKTTTSEGAAAEFALCQEKQTSDVSEWVVAVSQQQPGKQRNVVSVPSAGGL